MPECRKKVPKWSPAGTANEEKYEKCHARNKVQIWRRQKSAKFETRSIRTSIFGRSGGEGGRLESIPADFIRTFTRSAPRRGAADPKSYKIDAFGALGSDFGDFYGFGRGPDFYCFFIRQKGDPKSWKIIFWRGRDQKVLLFTGSWQFFFWGRGEGGGTSPRSWLDAGPQV